MSNSSGCGFVRHKTAALLALALALCLTAFTACDRRNDGEKPRVAVIVKALDSDFWHWVEDGVNSAATEYNVNVSFEGPDSEEDFAAQNELIRKAIDERVDVIVLSAISREASNELIAEAVGLGIGVITIDSAIDSEHVNLFIGTDNYAAGAAAGRAAVAASDGGALRIGVVNYYAATENGRARAQGFFDYIDKLDGAEIVETINVNSNETSATAGAISLLYRHPEINVLVGFNEWTTLGVGNAIKRSEVSERVAGIGFDTNVRSVEQLEAGDIDALIVQSPFSIGYLGVKYALELYEGAEIHEGEVFTDVQTVTKENLFDESVQKAVFRFVKQ